MPRVVSKLKVPLLLLLITIGFSWKLVLSNQYTWLDGSDNTFQVIPWLQEQARQWHGGHFPLWDSHLWTGQPIVGQVQPGTLNPLNWILFSMPLKDGFIQFPVLHWYWVMIHYLGVLFGYWLCRDLALSETASVLGGCAFGLGGFIGAIGWPQLMLSAVLLPLVLMFFLRVLREENVLANAAASGALLGASFLMGHHNVPLFFTLVMAGLWIYYFIRTRSILRWSTIAPAAAFTACFALIAAAQILPSVELGQLSLRWVGAPDALRWNERVPYFVHETFSFYPTGVLGIFIPGFQRNSSVFIGLVVLTLALLGAAARWHERMARVAAAVALAGLAFAMGGFNLFHGILYALIPNLDKARTPSMAEAIFHLGIVVLAAYGVDSIHPADSNRIRNRLAIRLLAALSLFLYALLIVLNTVRPEKSEEYKVLGWAALVAIAMAGILALWNSSRISNRAAGVLMVLLLLFELNNVSNYSYTQIAKSANLKKLSQDQDLAAFIRKNPGTARVDVDRDEIPYNFGDWYDLDELGGYLPSAPRAIVETQAEPRYRLLLAVNYSIGRKPSTPDQTIAFEGRSGLKVFSNPGVFPRARLVHRAIDAPDERAVVSTVLNPATDLQRTVVLQGSPPALDSCDGGDARITRYRQTSVVIHSSSPCRAMVILADDWFPGWKAFVDEKPAKIYDAYNVVRGVVVDAGEHDVVMLYRPASVFTGMALAALGILLCIALQFRRAR